MKIKNMPFSVTDWNPRSITSVTGATGTALTKSFEQGNIRVWMITYSENYKADHWCSRGHVVLVIDAHRAFTVSGATVFIVD